MKPRLTRLVSVLALASPLALAQTELAPITPEEVARLRAEIGKLESQSSEKRQRADRDLQTRNAECYQKILISACLEKSRKQDVAARIEIRQLQAEVRRIEREIRLRESATEKIEREAAQPRQDAEAQAEAARKREETAEREEAFARREAEHQKRLEEGRQRATEEKNTRARADAEAAARQAKTEKAARERAAKAPPPAVTSAGKPYIPPTMDIPAAPGSLAPKRD